MGKKIVSVLAIAGLAVTAAACLFPAYGLAQTAADATGAVTQAATQAAAAVPADATIADWSGWLHTLGGLKGAGLSAIIAAVVQLLMLISRTKISTTGTQKLVGVTGLTVGIGTPILTTLAGLGIPHAIANMAVLAATQVFAHQVKKNVTAA